MLVLKLLVQNLKNNKYAAIISMSNMIAVFLDRWLRIQR